MWKEGWGDFIKEKKANGQMRRREIVPKTEQARKSVKV